MSDALNCPLQACPEAMGHYFKFLEDAGKHIDPKTRNLTSVITKVCAQTERGSPRYLAQCPVLINVASATESLHE